MGYVLPWPVVERVLDVARVVRAVGWEGAVELHGGTWRGWEVHFLGRALTLCAEADRDAGILEQAHVWRAAMLGGGARPRDE
jgi:hypothetical protein